MQKLSDSKHLRLASKHLCLCWTLLASLLQDCSREWVERTCSWDKRYQRIELGLTRIDWLILLDDARHCKARSIPNMYQCTACRSLPWQILDGLRGILRRFLRRFQMVKAFCQVAEFAWNSWPVISKMSPDVSSISLHQHWQRGQIPASEPHLLQTPVILCSAALIRQNLRQQRDSLTLKHQFQAESPQKPSMLSGRPGKVNLTRNPCQGIGYSNP